MNTTNLKKLAPELRLELLDAVGARLKYVLGTDSVELREKAATVRELERSVKREGEAALIERVAYTWFNRLAALRFIDARGWHRFGCRVLTPASDSETQPELLKIFRSGTLPEDLHPYANLQRLNDLLDGRLPPAVTGANPQAEVHRSLILAACRYYNKLMPFLFEAIDDETELLLLDDLLTATSVAEGFRTEISDDDCSEVEILGWLYQFYISEKKDTVMARKKAVPSEDIPAVTQLFTPHWIVRYLVENSLGRLWLRSRPNSRLREHMPYYVEDPEGQAPADSLTVATPEEIKLLDPACGSGHMLTYAFDLLVKIYEEEGHAPSEIPEKILTHNLFGLEICPRAAQLAQFALVCKAREQSRAAFRRPVQPQVMCLRDVVLTPDEVKGFTDATGTQFSQDELAQIHQFREHTETFGSLIQPVLDGQKLADLKAKIGDQAPTGDLLVQNTQRKLRLVLDQAEMLSQRYQVVVLNPPYLGYRNMPSSLSAWSKKHYETSRYDVFSMFIERSIEFALNLGQCSMITMQSWMFLSSYEKLRARLLSEVTITSMAHLGSRAFDSISGEVVSTTAFIFENCCKPRAKGNFIRLVSGSSETEKSSALRNSSTNPDSPIRFSASSDQFRSIPGNPIAYWISRKVLDCFENYEALKATGIPRQGNTTTDNGRFVRSWFELSDSRIGYNYPSAEQFNNDSKKWAPYNKGGGSRKWYGQNESVVNWENDGTEIKAIPHSVVANEKSYFSGGITWSTISSGSFGFRFFGDGFIFDNNGACLFIADSRNPLILGVLNSIVFKTLLGDINPTLSLQPGDVGKFPLRELDAQSSDRVSRCIFEIVKLAKADWDNFETSWDFRDLPLLRSGDWEVETGQPGGPWKGGALAESWANYATYCTAAIRRMQELETENNRLWIDAYGLQDELTPEVPEDEITLARADPRKDVAAFLSYAVGCMLGRYSLDKPGLILANAGETVEDYLKQVPEPQFVPDADNIIPVLDGEWFEDDIVARFREFLKVTFGEDTLRENIQFIEESLGKELRKYFVTDFYSDHLKTYKKRPIYWLFQSPKKSFQALIYLHRYDRDTVNLLLNDYLREFQNKLQNRRKHLDEILASESTSARDKTAATKEQAKIDKSLPELADWERDVILPLAQQRLEIDLDDGVKQNYPKFGKALAKVAGLS